MKLILCLDDRNGLAFNRRRLSRDAEVCRRIVQLAGADRLWMNGYSYKLFEPLTAAAAVDEDFLEKAGQTEFCFTETSLPDMDTVTAVYVFRWNRSYPADLKFDPEQYGFTKTVAEEFTGNSHPQITLEVYTR